MLNETALFYIEKRRIKASVVGRGGSQREFDPARKQRTTAATLERRVRHTRSQEERGKRRRKSRDEKSLGA